MGWGCRGMGISWVGGVRVGAVHPRTRQCAMGVSAHVYYTRGYHPRDTLSPDTICSRVRGDGMGWDGMGYYLGWDGILSAHLYAGMGWDGMGGMGWVGSIYPRVRGDVDRAVHVAVQPVLACSGWESRWESRWE